MGERKDGGASVGIINSARFTSSRFQKTRIYHVNMMTGSAVWESGKTGEPPLG